MGTPEPWWRAYIVPALLAIATGLSGWSVAQHVVITTHDQTQEQRLAVIEWELRDLYARTAADEVLHASVVSLDTNMRTALIELGRIRDRIERLEGARR